MAANLSDWICAQAMAGQPQSSPRNGFRRSRNPGEYQPVSQVDLLIVGGHHLFGGKRSTKLYSRATGCRCFLHKSILSSSLTEDWQGLLPNTNCKSSIWQIGSPAGPGLDQPCPDASQLISDSKEHFQRLGRDHFQGPPPKKKHRSTVTGGEKKAKQLIQRRAENNMSDSPAFQRPWGSCFVFPSRAGGTLGRAQRAARQVLHLLRDLPGAAAAALREGGVR